MNIIYIASGKIIKNKKTFQTKKAMIPHGLK
jgi:hypothetical protein